MGARPSCSLTRSGWLRPICGRVSIPLSICGLASWTVLLGSDEGRSGKRYQERVQIVVLNGVRTSQWMFADPTRHYGDMWRQGKPDTKDLSLYHCHSLILRRGQLKSLVSVQVKSCGFSWTRNRQEKQGLRHVWTCRCMVTAHSLE